MGDSHLLKITTDKREWVGIKNTIGLPFITI